MYCYLDRCAGTTRQGQWIQQSYSLFFIVVESVVIKKPQNMQSDRLEAFRDMARANEEQSLKNDILMVLSSNPVPILVAIGTLFSLSKVTPASSKSARNRINEEPPKHPYPSWMTVGILLVLFQILHAIDFDIGIGPLSYGIAENSSGTSSSAYKPYPNFAEFYQEAYIDAHVEYASRVSHLVLASSVVIIFLWDTRLLVASMTALSIGAISTIPLARFDSEYIEMAIVLVTGMTVSKLAFNSVGWWFTFFLVWMLLDYLDHLMLGHNGSVAMYIGQHMISWGLIGQLQLSFNILLKGAVSY